MEETFDFVIIGSGGGSMCAALLLKSLGKSPVILEKTDLIGGSTARSGGVMWIPNNPFLKADGVEDSYEKATTYLETLIGDGDAGSTRARRAAYLTEAPRMIEFLISQGIKLRRVKFYPDYYDDLPGGVPAGRTVVADLFNTKELGAWRKKLRLGFLQYPASLDEMTVVATYKQSWAGKLALARVAWRGVTAALFGRKWANCGEALQGRMLQASIKAGIPIRTNVAVHTLLTDDGGRVVGVQANSPEGDVTIRASDGVLINAGGFAHNQQMRDTYQPRASAKWTNASPGDTGEMIEEAMRLGAAVAQMDEMVGGPIALPPDGPEIHPMIQREIGSPHAIVVDQSGQRFVRETVSYMEFCQTVFERDKTVPAVPSWMILDSQYIEKYMLAGSFAGAKKPQSWFDSGFLRKGETLGDLARACAIEPAALTATVERFNKFARKGLDEDFRRGTRAYDDWLGDPTHKPSTTLGTIEKAPFYAIQVYPGDVGTFGGLVADEHARVLREDGSVIDGLYATGTSTAAVVGRAYPGAGASIGPAFTFGFIAAKHAAHAGNA